MTNFVKSGGNLTLIAPYNVLSGGGFPSFLPDQLQGQVLVRLQFLVDLDPIRLRMFAPKGGSGPLRKQRLLDLLVAPVLRRRPIHARSLRGRQILMEIGR